MLIVRAVLLCCVLLVSGVCFAQPKSPPPKPVNQAAAAQQNAKEDHRGTEESPLFVNIKSIPQSTEEEKAEKATERHEKSESDWWLVKLTGALVAVTLILAIATVFLWASTAKLVRDAKDTAKRQLRAYVSVTPVDVGIRPETPYIKLLLTNHGQTPALNVTTRWNGLEIFANPIPNNFPFSGHDVSTDSRFVLFPGQERDHHYTRPFPFTKQEHEQITSKDDFRWYFFGVIEYMDIFDVPHRTEYCVTLESGPQIAALKAICTGRNSIAGDWKYANQHNDAD